MNKKEFKETPAIDHIRLMEQNFGDCSESFNQRFSLEQLFAIHKAWMLSEWDVYPERWTVRQIREALKGKPPRWDDDGKPVYARKAARKATKARHP